MELARPVVYDDALRRLFAEVHPDERGRLRAVCRAWNRVLADENAWADSDIRVTNTLIYFRAAMKYGWMPLRGEYGSQAHIASLKKLDPAIAPLPSSRSPQHWPRIASELWKRTLSAEQKGRILELFGRSPLRCACACKRCDPQ